MRSRIPALALIAAGAVLSAAAPPVAPAVGAQPGGDGIDWVTIGAVNNPAYDGDDPFNRVRGRGGVGYEYKIGRFEVTSAQWREFFNASLNRPDGPIPWVLPATQIGSGMAPVGGVSWRTCAIFCNWLHNNKSLDRAAFLSGAYDVSTFGDRAGPGGVSTDPGSGNVVLVAIVSGDIAGDVTVGEVYTLRSLAGRIRGTVEATKDENLADRTDDAIKHVFAQDGIGIAGVSKAVQATGANGSIGIVKVGPRFDASGNEVAFGIDADIRAEGGRAPPPAGRTQRGNGAGGNRTPVP